MRPAQKKKEGEILRNKKVKELLLRLVQTLQVVGYQANNNGLNKLADLDILCDPRAQERGKIIQEALNPPSQVSRRRHLEGVSQKYGISMAKMYRLLQAFDQKGIHGLKHGNRK